jgi:hypothetical protein
MDRKLDLSVVVLVVSWLVLHRFVLKCYKHWLGLP